jgi:hypothetical protein
MSKDNSIKLWYGKKQSITSNTQPYINILGNYSEKNVHKIHKINCIINGKNIKVNIGPDTRRLQDTGDFNIDIPTSTLKKHNIIIVDDKKVLLTYDPKQVQLPLIIDQNTLRQIQIVDGYWSIKKDCIRTINPGYDRIVAIGDSSWRNYVVKTKIKIYDVQSAGPVSADPGIGMILHWKGHSDDPISGWHPKSGWKPFGMIIFYRILGKRAELQLYGNNKVYTKIDVPIVKEFTLISSVQNVKDQGCLYKARIPELHAELSCQVSFKDPDCGSLCLLAHHVDAAFNNVTIKPLKDAKPTISGHIGNAKEKFKDTIKHKAPILVKIYKLKNKVIK